MPHYKRHAGDHVAGGDDPHVNLSNTGLVAFTNQPTYTTGADTNNYGLAAAAYILYTPSANNLNWTGIDSGTGGRILLIHNTTTTNTTFFKNESASSSAANRILTPGAVDFALVPQGVALLVYSGSVSRWIVEGLSLSSTTPSALGTATAGTENRAARADHVHAAPTVLKSMQVLTDTTTSDRTYTTPANVKSILVFAIGAGGQGGGAPTNPAAGAGGGGGGGGAWAQKIYTTPAATYKYRVGLKGSSAAAGAAGNAGTDSVWKDSAGTTLWTVGGGAGGSAGASGNPVLAGLGGAVTNGTETPTPATAGAAGNNGIGVAAASAMGGNGGSGPFGGGGRGNRVTTTAGTNVGAGGEGAGSGGGGSATGSTGGQNAGGAGADGVIVVYEYGV